MSGSPERFSAIIVAWKSRPAVEARLEEWRQLHEAMQVEFVLVDNASDDGLAQVLRSRVPWIRLIENSENIGFARACNLGAAATDAPLLLFMNPDAAIAANSLALLAEALRNDPLAAMAGPSLVDSGGQTYPSAHNDPNALNYWRTHSIVSPLWRALRARLPRTNKTHEADWLMGACLLARREAFDAAGGFPEAYFLYSEDAELAYRMRQASRRLLHVPEAVCRHEHAQSARQDALRTRVELFRSLRIYGERCRNEKWLRAMRRSVLLDMALRRLAVALLRIFRNDYDRDNSRRESIRVIREIWRGKAE